MDSSKHDRTNLIFLFTITPAPDRLKMTALERRIVRLAALGCVDVQIAAILGRSEQEIRAHRTRTIQRLGIPQGRALARWAAQQGLSHAGDRLSPSERGALVPQGS